jgi:hypothetical protein
VYATGQSPPAGGQLSEAGLNDSVTFEVDNLGAWEAATTGTRKVVPYLNGLAIRGNYPISVDTSKNTITFTLRRVRDGTADNLEAWAVLLRQPNVNKRVRPVRATVGTDDGSQVLPIAKNRNVDSEGNNLGLVVLPWWWGLLAVVVLVVLGALCYFAVRSDLLRDNDLEPFSPAERKPYSLARTQMAVWFVLILASYATLWAVTGQLGEIPSAVLGLMGVSGGTAVAAVSIDANRRAERQRLLAEAKKKLDDEIADLTQRIAATPPNVDQLRGELSEKQRALERLDPKSRGFLLDVLSDDDGVGFHRFQILAWTLLLSFVFVATVYNTLAMPEFSLTLLGLMGLSAGTYLGFKLPEQKVPEQKP